MSSGFWIKLGGVVGRGGADGTICVDDDGSSMAGFSHCGSLLDSLKSNICSTDTGKYIKTIRTRKILYSVNDSRSKYQLIYFHLAHEELQGQTQFPYHSLSQWMSEGMGYCLIQSIVPRMWVHCIRQ